MESRHVTVVIIPDVQGRGYTVTVPLLPGCVAEGETLDHALADIREAISLYISSLPGNREPIPCDPMPAAVMEGALAAARDIIRQCAEDHAVQAPLPEPYITTVDVPMAVAATTA